MNTDTGDVFRVGLLGRLDGGVPAASAALASSPARVGGIRLGLRLGLGGLELRLRLGDLGDSLLLRQLRLLGPAGVLLLGAVWGRLRAGLSVGDSSALCAPFRTPSALARLASAAAQRLGGRRRLGGLARRRLSLASAALLAAASASADLAAAIDFRICTCLAEPGAGGTSLAERRRRAASPAPGRCRTHDRAAASPAPAPGEPGPA